MSNLGSKREKTKNTNNEEAASANFYLTAIAMGIEKMTKINDTDVIMKKE